MGKFPAKHEDDFSLHNFTPTAGEGFALSSAQYKYLNSKTVYINMRFTCSVTTALSGHTVCTLPSGFRVNATGLNVTGLDGSYNPVITNGILFTSSGVIKATTTARCYDIYVTGILALS